MHNPYIWAKGKHIFDELSIDLKYNIAMQVQDKMMSKIKIFADCTDQYFIIRIVSLLKFISVDCDQILYEEKESPAAIYFLLFGRVNY